MSEYLIITLGLALIGVLELLIVLLVRRNGKRNDEHLDDLMDKAVDRIRKRMDREPTPPGFSGPNPPSDVEAWVRDVVKGG